MKTSNSCNKASGVDICVKKTAIPTYKPKEPNVLPMFIEKKAYQGATGRVYPIPYTDRLPDRLTDEEYNTVVLENEYIAVTVLPDIGGKIHSARDKSNGYNFIYENNVIKPAMIGLAGQWVSGGIEFNWPQHHRPTTFMPLDFACEDNSDGSKTVWAGEVEPFNRTKGMAGITVCPGRSYIKVKVKLYNRTPYPQTFMWWANLAVHVHDRYKVVFPPDVEYVNDHDRRAVISYPLMKGIYRTARPYDYGDGTDGSWFPNIVVPTSLMVMNGQSEFDFLSGYDFDKGAGIVHVANHHISTGKKLFTWGAGDFGRAWADNLTDSDGPYVELMTGVYTDNQPDFSWIQPYETKEFEQYWYPVKDIGIVKNATVDAAVSLDYAVNDNNNGINVGSGGGIVITAGFCPSGRFEGSRAVLKYCGEIIFEKIIDISPDKPYMVKVPVAGDKIRIWSAGRETTGEEAATGEIVEREAGFDEHELEALLISAEGKSLVSYKPVRRGVKSPPEPRLPALPPKEIMTTEELYLNGLHLEQYRHHTYEPKSYYMEALKRDPGDIRCNNAMGMLMFRNGQFAEAEAYLRKAAERLALRNDNPYDTEVYYNLGLVLKMTEREDEAYRYYYKATWHYAWKSAGYYALAEISAAGGDFITALKEIGQSLATNSSSNKGRNLKAALLRKSEKPEEALALAKETVSADYLDLWARYEVYAALRDMAAKDKAAKSAAADSAAAENAAAEALRSVAGMSGGGSPSRRAEAFIDVALDYADAGLYDDAKAVLETAGCSQNPMLYYYMGYFHMKAGMAEKALRNIRKAEKMPADYCFPNRLESIKVLTYAKELNPEGAKAFYYLGNLLYDRFRYDEAIDNWEKSRELDSSFFIVHRNLGIAYHDKKADPVKARESFERAFTLDSSNSRLFFELQQLYKNTGVPIDERLKLYNEYPRLVDERDDCYLEKVVLLTQKGRLEEAAGLLKQRTFKIYEGGEGKLTKHHGWLHTIIGLQHFETGRYKDALAELREALVYPKSYGEGKSYKAQETHIHYFAGVINEKAGEQEAVAEAYSKAAQKSMAVTDVSYFEGLALAKLGRLDEAAGVFKAMVSEGERLIAECGKYEYFGVGMPIPQPFEGDIKRLNTVTGSLLKGLGYKGLGDAEKSGKAFSVAHRLDPYNFKLHVYNNTMVTGI